MQAGSILGRLLGPISVQLVGNEIGQEKEKNSMMSQPRS